MALPFHPSSFHLLALFLLVSFSMADDYQEIQVRSHSLQAPFVDADLQNRNWEFGGSSMVINNQFNQLNQLSPFLRLTPDVQSKAGWIWSRSPFTSDNWVIEFEFRVGGHASKFYGDGFAFWFTKERAQAGPAFGSTDKFTGLGIFFDTFANVRHRYSFPFVNVMVGDGLKEYSVENDNDKTSLAGCEAFFRKSPFPTKARVTYILGTLKLDLDHLGKNEWKECFKVENLIIEGPHYIGFSAMTGDVSDSHDILSVSSFVVAVPQEETDEAKRKMKSGDALLHGSGYKTNSFKGAADFQRLGMREDEGRSKSFQGLSELNAFFIFITMFLCAAGMIAFYRSHRVKKNKRF